MRTILQCILFISSNLFCFAQHDSIIVHFDFNKFDVPDSSAWQLVTRISQKKFQYLTVESHCDNIGSDAFNQNLSQKRAKAIKLLLIANGIEPSYIKTYLAFGEKRPITNNETDESRQQNRRAIVHFYTFEVAKSSSNSPSSTIQKTETTSSPIEAEVIEVNEATIKQLEVTQFKKGKTLRFNNLLFIPGYHHLIESSYQDLYRLIKVLRENENIEIEIQGHVCCAIVEPDGHDAETGLDNLSVARAYAVFYFLRANGIDEERMRYKGFGGRKKINQDESTEALRAVNRRIEILITNE
jgi:outer membrane protein OmpA-like peptidoglycan-associated protein